MAKLRVGDLVWHVADAPKPNDKKDIGEVTGFTEGNWGELGAISYVWVKWRSQKPDREPDRSPDVNIKPVTWNC